MVALILATPKNIGFLAAGYALLTAVGGLPWLFFIRGHPAFFLETVLLADLGGCLAVDSLAFVFLLNNAERFYGTALTLLGIGFVELNTRLILKEAWLGRKENRYDAAIPLALFILLAYFAIRFMNFYVPLFHYRPSPSGKNDGRCGRRKVGRGREITRSTRHGRGLENSKKIGSQRQTGGLLTTKSGPPVVILTYNKASARGKTSHGISNSRKPPA